MLRAMTLTKYFELWYRIETQLDFISGWGWEKKKKHIHNAPQPRLATGKSWGGGWNARGGLRHTRLDCVDALGPSTLNS